MEAEHPLAGTLKTAGMVSKRGDEMGWQEDRPRVAILGVSDEGKVLAEPNVLTKDA